MVAEVDGRLGATRTLGLTDSNDAIPDQFIVRFGDTVGEGEVEQLAAKIASLTGGEILWSYKHAFKGVALTRMPESSLGSILDSFDVGEIEQVRVESAAVVSAHLVQLASLNTASHTGTIFVRQDELVKLDAVQIHAPRVLVEAELNAPLGLDRIDQSSLPLDEKYEYRYNGNGVKVFVIDTGIRKTHIEFEGREPICGFDAFGSADDVGGCFDGFGHGTHVAGIVGGKSSGVAKNVTLISVKALGSDGSGSWASLIAGIDHVIGEKKDNSDTPMVINMSLGGRVSLSVDKASVNKAVASAVDAGIVVVVAAGNENKNACLFSPASDRKAITVGASTGQDQRASFSNYGTCLDLFA
jgi:subtilisin family serine protease